ncbi:putative malic acid transport protein [Lachnellula suecica]|uniref:Putative malic acid transport protein n=1 Tax=Lachnellula suecica TaxID=602035 RepID=A0A8T9C8X6_9HELO|nr:putative malic acid transport protein [Lachnellula suecica]
MDIPVIPANASHGDSFLAMKTLCSINYLPNPLLWTYFRMTLSRGHSQRRASQSSLEGQRGTLRTSKETLHGNVGIRDRIHHFTWAWFTLTMSTGGIALLLAKTPHRFKGLTVLGDIVFILDLVLFICLCAGISARFILFPKTFASSMQHPTESLFFPTFWISIVNILSNIQSYGVPRCGDWLVITLRVFFWIYVACTFCVAVGQYFFLFTGKPLTVQSFTPAWILPVFPVMLTGTLASVIGSSQPSDQALPIAMAGVTFQGLGILISTYMYGIYLGRLMSSGLPRADTRPGMFIAVGPPAFTGLTFLGISSNLASIYPAYTTVSGISHPEIIADIFRIVALCAAVFLWATAFWFFSVALVSVVEGALSQGMTFHLVWWAFVFPNVGFTICTINIGQALESSGILWLSSVMTVLLVVVWLFVGLAHIRAVWKKQILWPGKDEDHDQ